MKSESQLLIYLTRVVFDTQMLHHKTLSYEGHRIERLAVVDETESWRNGLQAAAYRVEGFEPIFLVIRGADVGIGRQFFRKTGANERFIPKSNEDSSWKTIFQDWIWTSMLGSMGLVSLHQYDTLREFYHHLMGENEGARLVVSGVSLGGLLAQRLYILEDKVDRCITFSALSPWWTFYRGTQDLLRQEDFLKQDPNMINYYSNHDIFRWSPPLNRALGCQYNVLLQPFQSRSNLLATLIERIYWAHIPNYYSYSSTGEIRVKNKQTRSERCYRWLNQKTTKSGMIDGIVLLGILVSSLLIVFGLGLGLQLLWPQIVTLSSARDLMEHFGNHSIWGSLVTSVMELFFFLPTLLSKSHWKVVLLGLNSLSIFVPLFWPLLLTIALCSRRTADEIMGKE